MIKSARFTIIALLLSTYAIFAQAVNQHINVLKWTTTDINLGSVTQGKPVTVTFGFINTSKKPVVLKNVKPECGCTTADYTRVPVSKGKTGFVKVTYNAAYTGAFKKAINITTDKGETIALMIHGEVLPKPINK